MRRHLYFYTLVDSSAELASRLLGGDPAAWLPPPATPLEDGWKVELRADGALPNALARHSVLVDLGVPTDGTDRFLRSLRWRSATAPGLFPVFAGDLEVVALSGGVSQLSLMGTYRPPLSVAGNAGDALIGHHVAEACVRRFVLDTSARMTGVTLTA